MPPPARLNARTCGPPPGPAPVMMSARPSPSTSPHATIHAAAEERVVGVEAGQSRDDAARETPHATCGPPPGPAPVTISSRPSPSTSHFALMRILVLIVALLLAGFGSLIPLRTVAALVISGGAAVPPATV